MSQTPDTAFFDEVPEILSHFAVRGRIEAVSEIKVGHINRTYRVSCKDDSGVMTHYILQWINSHVFPKVPEVMENIVAVTAHIRKKLEAAGKDAHRGTLNVIPLKDGTYYYSDENDGKWRVFEFISNARTYMLCTSPALFESVGHAFGEFQYQLSDFEASSLHVTIEDFHNTPKRYRRFLEAVEKDVCGRAKDVQDEIEFVKARADRYSCIVDKLDDGSLPLRVTHNDTKLNNVMIDDTTGEAICVIDLDTVMPGSSLYDFGDAIRFGASSADEDEKDLSRVFVKMDLYEAFTRGFLSALNGALSDTEVRMFPDGTWMMTAEVGMRFLTDYLEGDTYFRTDYPDHNLVRARNQFKLVRDLEDKDAEIRAMVEKYI